MNKIISQEEMCREVYCVYYIDLGQPKSVAPGPRRSEPD